ncbi:MAG: sugar ABC transporter permease [Anaerolineaceae bacterium]|nr:sugar ABC transporter permease [Anaerolineaceae bacterium]
MGLTKKRRKFDEDKAFPHIMLAPTIIVMLVMTVYPIAFTIYYSFTDYNLLKAAKKGYNWIGFDNFTKLFQNAVFRTAIMNTIKFTIFAVIAETIIGLLIALFVNSLHRGQKVMRTLLLLPYLLPTVTVALAWRMLLSSNYGPVNQWLVDLGFKDMANYNWFYHMGTAFWTVWLIDVWQNVPFVFLLLYASLQGVPTQQYEAAELDGANMFEKFFYVTFPNIRSSIFLCLLLRTIDTFRLFDKVNILTQGGPVNTTTTITQYLYAFGIKTLNFGFGSAGSLVMTILVLLLAIPYIRTAIGAKK